MEKDIAPLVRKAIKGSKSAYGELIAAYQVYLHKTAVILFYFQELKSKKSPASWTFQKEASRSACIAPKSS